jgi:hypothetical protein
MGLLRTMFGGSNDEPRPATIRDTLFGDMPLSQWPADSSLSRTFPWNAFAKARAHLAAGKRDSAVECWREVVRQPDLESRHYLQAWHFLRTHGVRPSHDAATNVLGTIVEVALPEGLDLLAAYADKSARYYNHGGGGIIWEHPDGSLDATIDELLQISSVIIEDLGPWEGERPEPPPAGQVRLSFLTPSGLHFGEAPWSALSGDPTAARLLEIGTSLMTAMVEKAKAA